MVVTLELRATQNGVIWPRRPLVSSKGLLSCLQNVPHSSYDRRATNFRAVAFNASGDGFAAADEKGRVFVFFVTSNKYTLAQHLGAPTVACCFSPTRKSELLVTCENEMIRCIDVHSQTLISSLRGHRFPARSASFQRSGNLALTASQDAVILWDTKDWSRYRVLNAGPGVEHATFVTKGDLVAVCFQDDSIMMWELDSLALRYRFSIPPQEQPAGVNKIAVSDDHRILVATGRSRFIYVWDFEAQTIIRIIELPAPIEGAQTFAFVPGHESTICLLGNEGSLFFLNVGAKSPKIKLEISNPGRKIIAFDIENHGRYLAACTDDGCLLLYDLDIANDTARRSHLHRRKNGLGELEDNLRLHTRPVTKAESFSVSPSAARYHTEQDTERPASSKLIDGIFGLKTKKDKENVIVERKIEFQEKRPVKSRASTSPHAIANLEKRSSKQVDQLSTKARADSKSALKLTTLSEDEIQLNRKRLQSSLDCNGKYPAKYRLLVWKFLLRLPKNEEAFRALTTKGPHPVYAKLHEEYPLKNQRQLRRLHRVLSAIAFWCPAFGEVGYLPAVVYPFVKLYRENDVAAFEASLSILLHWCRDFMVSLPYPPVFVLSTIESQLEKLDPQLHDHFVKHNITAEVYGWSLLKSIFTEVLSDDEWMCLWDHLLTASDKPRMMQVAVLAYVSYFRTALLAAKDRFSIEQFFHQQNALQMHALIQLLKSLGTKYPFPDVPSDSAVNESYWPLPKGQYPAFANYPKFVVDFQIAERNRIALEEAEMVQKKRLLKRVEFEVDKLKAEHQKFLQQRQALLAAEENRRNEMLATERNRILNLKTLDHETRKRRLDRLAYLEKTAHETLEQTSKLFEAEYLRLENELGMLKERSEFEISSRRQEEELQRLEFETEKRVTEIHKEREIAERLQQLRTEFVTRVKQDELQDILLFENWKREDEKQRSRSKIELEAREKDALLQQERTIRQQLENKLLDHALEKEQQLLELKSHRKARVREERASQQINRDFEENEREVARASNLKHVDLEPARTREECNDDDDSENAASDEDGARRNVRSQQSRTNRQNKSEESEREPRPNSRTVLQPDEPPGPAPVNIGADLGDEFDGAEHITNESIRMLDKAKRRLSSVLHQSNDDNSSSSSSSIAVDPVERTKQELLLLEKALADISSGSESDGSTRLQRSFRSHTSARQRELFQGISPINKMQHDNTIPMSNATELLRAEEEESAQQGSNREGNHLTSLTGSEQIRQEMEQAKTSLSMPSLLSSDESEEANSMLQRPIEELEKELGIRFGNISDEEKEDDSDDDDELEDDRNELLQRAKRLLATQSLVSDDEEDDDSSDDQALH